MPWQQRRKAPDEEDERPRNPALETGGIVTAIRSQQRNPERVNIFLDGSYAFAAAREDVVQQGLRIEQELTPAQIAGFLARDEVNRAISSALTLLGVRARAEKELRDRLKLKGFAPETVELAIERVAGWGYLNDGDFARRWIENRSDHQPRGKRMLEQELRQKGVDRDTIAESLDAAELDEVAAATVLAEKAIRKMSGLPPDVAKRRITGQLARRGFDFPTIRAALDRAMGDPPSDEAFEEE